MIYKNNKCPVCDVHFSENDDIVVCPDCGTAHHRECWKANGKCFNHHRHGEDFENVKEVEEYSEAPEFSEEENGFSEPENNENFNEDTTTQMGEIIDSFEKKTEEEIKINGEPLLTYAAAVGKKENYYLMRFLHIEKANPKSLWNGAAFLIPFTWALYRKMYKLAAIVMALYMVLFGGLVYSVFADGEIMRANEACLQEDPAYLTNVVSYLNGDEGVKLTKAQTHLIEEMQEIKVPMVVEVLSYAITYGTRIFMGMKATLLYFEKIKKSISKAKSLGFSGERLRLYLSRKCGTLSIIIVGIAALFEVYLFFF
jgi:hypothetical protein